MEISNNTMNMANGHILYLNTGEQIYLHTGTPEEGDVPISNITPEQLLLLNHQITNNTNDNGLPLILNNIDFITPQDNNIDILPLLVNSNETFQSHSPILTQNIVTPIETESENKEDESDIADDSPAQIEDVIDLFDIIYKCKICSEIVPDRNLLISHIQHNHVPYMGDENETEDQTDLENNGTKEKLIFLCAQCAEAFDSIESLKTHMVIDHKLVTEEQLSAMHNANKENNSNKKTEGVIEMNDEPLLSKRESKLPQHLRETFQMASEPITDTSNLKFKCVKPGCSHSFYIKKEIEIHMACHNTIERNFRCFECKQIFAKWKPCSMHLWNAHKIDIALVSCNICDRKFTQNSTLDRHMKIHSTARNYKCHICEKSFKQKSQLGNHFVTHKQQVTENSTKWYSSKICSICDKKFSDSKSLKKHVAAVHNKMRPYSCAVCGHTSSRKALLQLHMRQHTGEKPYSCEDCDYRTGDHNSLRRHKMRHNGLRPYKCIYCDYSCIQSNQFKYHLKQRHPDDKGVLFECDNCSYHCLSEDTFKLHISEHKRQEKLRELKSDIFPINTNLILNCLENVEVYDSGNNISSQLFSSDGSLQSITIKVPTDDDYGCIRVEDLIAEKPAQDEPDLGGITIPADVPYDPLTMAQNLTSSL